MILGYGETSGTLTRPGGGSLRGRASEAPPVRLSGPGLFRSRRRRTHLGVPEDANEGIEHHRPRRSVLPDEVPVPADLHGRSGVRGVSRGYVVPERHTRERRTHHPGAPPWWTRRR